MFKKRQRIGDQTANPELLELEMIERERTDVPQLHIIRELGAGEMRVGGPVVGTDKTTRREEIYKGW